MLYAFPHYGWSLSPYNNTLSLLCSGKLHVCLNGTGTKQVSCSGTFITESSRNVRQAASMFYDHWRRVNGRTYPCLLMQILVSLFSTPYNSETVPERSCSYLGWNLRRGVICQSNAIEGGERGLGEKHPIKQVVWSESPYPVNLRPGSLGPGLQVWASRHFA